MAISTSSWPAWTEALTAADLRLVGRQHETPADVLAGFVDDDGVDLDGVTRCLGLLKSMPVVLHCGVPRALMAFSALRGSFIASFDCELSEELDALTDAQAGLWLALVSTEAGELPATPEHWYCISVDGRWLSGRDRGAIDTYLAHADVLDTHATDVDDYDRLISRAFWTCAARCQEGR